MGATNKELYNISREDCLKIYPQILANSNKNCQASTVLAGNGFYGQAISLQIVGLEEMIKSLVILLDGHGYEFRNTKGMHRFFKEHGIRHYTAYILLILYIFGEAFVQKLETLVKDPQKAEEWLDLIKDETVTEMIVTTYFTRKLVQLKTELPFFTSMDQQRQIGFYCDYNQRFSSPEMVTKKEYEYARFRIDKILALGKQVINVFESENAELKKQRDQLLLFFKANQIYDRLSLLFTSRTTALFQNIDTWIEQFITSSVEE